MVREGGGGEVKRKGRLTYTLLHTWYRHGVSVRRL